MAHPEPHPHCSASLQCSAWHTSQQPSSSHEQIGSVDMAKVRFLTDTVKDHQQTWTGICSKLNLSFLISSGKSFFGKLSPSLDQRLCTVPYWVLFRFTISVRTFNLIFQLVLIHFWKKIKSWCTHCAKPWAWQWLNVFSTQKINSAVARASLRWSVYNI